MIFSLCFNMMEVKMEVITSMEIHQAWGRNDTKRGSSFRRAQIKSTGVKQIVRESLKIKLQLNNKIVFNRSLREYLLNDLYAYLIKNYSTNYNIEITNPRWYNDIMSAAGWSSETRPWYRYLQDAEDITNTLHLVAIQTIL